jgi:hypothetical protein
MLKNLKLRHENFAKGVAQGEPLADLCARLDFPLEVGERLIKSPTFHHYIEKLRDASKS